MQAGSERAIIAAAFFTLLIPNDPSYKTSATSQLSGLVAKNCWEPEGNACLRSGDTAGTLVKVSLVYDWLYPQLTATEKDQTKMRIALEVCRYYEAFTYGAQNKSEGWNNWWMENYAQNHFHNAAAGMMLGALAIKEDNPPPCTVRNKSGQKRTVTYAEIIDFGLQQMERTFLLFDQMRDGSYPEGDSYVATYSRHYLIALWAVDRLLSPRILIREQRLRLFPLFYLYNSPPGQLWNTLTNHGDFYTSSRENYPFPRDLHLVATVHKDPLAAWMAEQYYYDKGGKQISIPVSNKDVATNTVLDFIFAQPGLTPRSPADSGLDLSHHARDWDGVLTRNSWNDTAVAAALKAGPPGGHTVYNIARSNFQLDHWIGGGLEPTELELAAWHMHADANGLYLYANKTFLLPEMLGYGDDRTPWGKYTSAHNTIMVSDDQGRMRGQIQGDDVGGVGLSYNSSYPGYEHFWKISPPENRTGIIEHASTMGYDYSLGQATSAYWPELGLKRFHRHTLFIRDPGYLLVVDDLDAAQQKTYDWMGHSTGNVVKEGSWLKVNADNNQRLGISVVSPSSFQFNPPANSWKGISLSNIYQFRYVSAQRQMYEWKIRQNCQACRFITLLWPTDESRWNQKPSVIRLADTNQLAAVQVNFTGTNRVDTLAISFIPGQKLAAGTLTFDGRTAAVTKVGSAIQRALLLKGTQLLDGQIDLVRSLPSNSFIEVQYEGNKLTLRSPNPKGTILYAPGVTSVAWQNVDQNNVVKVQFLAFTRNGNYITLAQ